MEWDGTDFTGSKGALLCGDKILIYLRDNKPGLRFANLWDFPGGAREGGETPFECFAREVQEEFSITLPYESILWHRKYPSMYGDPLPGHFFVATITESDVQNIRFGDEGQRWEVTPVETFLGMEGVIQALKDRLCDYLATTPTASSSGTPPGGY